MIKENYCFEQTIKNLCLIASHLKFGEAENTAFIYRAYLFMSFVSSVFSWSNLMRLFLVSTLKIIKKLQRYTPKWTPAAFITRVIYLHDFNASIENGENVLKAIFFFFGFSVQENRSKMSWLLFQFNVLIRRSFTIFAIEPYSSLKFWKKNLLEKNSTGNFEAVFKLKPTMKMN